MLDARMFVRVCVYIRSCGSSFPNRPPLHPPALAGTAATTSSWRRVRTARRPGTVPWWPPAAASCCPRVSQERKKKKPLWNAATVVENAPVKRDPPVPPRFSPGVYRAPERSCQPVAEHYGAPTVRCRELPFTQHPSHMPLERFLQSPEAQSANSPAGGVAVQRPGFVHNNYTDTIYQNMMI